MIKLKKNQQQKQEMKVMSRQQRNQLIQLNPCQMIMIYLLKIRLRVN